MLKKLAAARDQGSALFEKTSAPPGPFTGRRQPPSWTNESWIRLAPGAYPQVGHLRALDGVGEQPQRPAVDKDNRGRPSSPDPCEAFTSSNIFWKPAHEVGAGTAPLGLTPTPARSWRPGYPTGPGWWVGRGPDAAPELRFCAWKSRADLLPNRPAGPFEDRLKFAKVRRPACISRQGDGNGKRAATLSSRPRPTAPTAPAAAALAASHPRTRRKSSPWRPPRPPRPPALERQADDGAGSAARGTAWPRKGVRPRLTVC